MAFLKCPEIESIQDYLLNNINSEENFKYVQEQAKLYDDLFKNYPQIFNNEENRQIIENHKKIMRLKFGKNINKIEKESNILISSVFLLLIVGVLILAYKYATSSGGSKYPLLAKQNKKMYKILKKV